MNSIHERKDLLYSVCYLLTLPIPNPHLHIILTLTLHLL